MFVFLHCSAILPCSWHPVRCPVLSVLCPVLFCVYVLLECKERAGRCLKSHITADIDDSDAKIEIIYFAEYGFCPKFANKKDDDTGR